MNNKTINSNYNIRDEFLTKIFAINNLKCSENILKYHNENYMLVKSYNEKAVKDLDYIIKSNKIKFVKEILISIRMI